jgi:hypothetical protein
MNRLEILAADPMGEKLAVVVTYADDFVILVVNGPEALTGPDRS